METAMGASAGGVSNRNPNSTSSIILNNVNTAAFTNYAGATLQRLIMMNNNTSAPTPICTSPFHSVSIPPITIRDYVARFARHSSCSPESLLIAILYMMRYVANLNNNVTLDPHSVHRLFITAVVLAIKGRDDVYYSNKYYAQIGGISNVELNALEVRMWTGLQREMWVDPEEFYRFVEAAENDYRDMFVAV
eukprot:PhF_6_TR11515/c0_g1_i3/m.18428